MIQPRLLAAIGFVAAAFISACTALVEGPSFEVTRARVTDLGVEEGRAQVTLRLATDQTQGLNLRGILYEILVEDVNGRWVTLAEGYSVQDALLRPDEPYHAELAIPLRFIDGLERVRDRMQSGDVPYRLEGEFRILSGMGEVPVGFSATGVLSR